MLEAVWSDGPGTPGDYVASLNVMPIIREAMLHGVALGAYGMLKSVDPAGVALSEEEARDHAKEMVDALRQQDQVCERMVRHCAAVVADSVPVELLFNLPDPDAEPGRSS